MRNAIKRNMTKTKREQVKLVENMNRDAINQIFQGMNQLATSVATVQTELLVLRNALKRTLLIDDFVLEQERTNLREMQEMESKALVLGQQQKDNIVKPI